MVDDTDKLQQVTSKQSALFETYSKSSLTIVRGCGSFVWDDQGNKYLDFMSGIAVTNLGHVPSCVKQKVLEQIDHLWHLSNLYTHENQEWAAQLLTANSCLDAVFFCNSGAEANEAAIKLARRYYQEVLQQDRYEIVTFAQSFHGRTLATLTATGQAKVQVGFSPLPTGFKYVPYNDIAAVKTAINEKTCAIMLELIQAEGGVFLADPEFIHEISELCRDNQVLLIIDEVQTGMGRTGKLFAYEHFGIEPDIITLAKGLGSGFPIGAMLGKSFLCGAFMPGSHGSTFGGNPITTAAAIATLETMIEDDVPKLAQLAGHYLMQQLQLALCHHEIVREIRGMGLLMGIACTVPVANIIKRLQQSGLLVISAGLNVLRLLPNLLVSKEEMDWAVLQITREMTQEVNIIRGGC